MIRCLLAVFGSAVFVGAHVGAAPLFEQDSVLTIELTGPITEVFAGSAEKIESAFTLRADGSEHTIKVRLRGNSRLRVCKFLPLRLNFATKAAAGTLFEDQDKLKLVTHCRNHERGEQDMLEEYLAYRIFNLLSDISYRVRLLRITYTDVDGKLAENAHNRYGFVIESTDELSARVEATPNNLIGIPRNSLDPDQAALVYIFHYLIGNTDWSIVTADGDEFCCHNGDLFAVGSKQYLVPYDFDLSGLVNARYAKPDPSLRISRVTRRLYRGYCTDPVALQKALQDIIDKRSEIMAVASSIPGLLPKETSTARKYLQNFFEQAVDQQNLLDHFKSRCI